MADEVGEQTARPADPAFKERKLHLRKAPHHSAEEQRLADRVCGGSEMADVVVYIVRNGGAAAPSFAMAMKARHHLELLALGPHRVVIMLAVDAKGIEPEGIAGGFGVLACHSRNRTFDVARHQHGLQPQHVYRIFEFLKRLL